MLAPLLFLTGVLKGVLGMAWVVSDVKLCWCKWRRGEEEDDGEDDCNFCLSSRRDRPLSQALSIHKKMYVAAICGMTLLTPTTSSVLPWRVWRSHDFKMEAIIRREA